MYRKQNNYQANVNIIWIKKEDLFKNLTIKSKFYRRKQFNEIIKYFLQEMRLEN